MKHLTLLVLICGLAACSKPSNSESAAKAAASDPFVQKLNSLPESERAEYARTHAAEAMASAGAKAPAPSNP